MGESRVNEGGGSGAGTNSGGEVQYGDRLCFVIMPFSATKACTEDEWTRVFEELFEPTIREFGYECRRSNATRGSLIKAIIRDLELAWVVLADLTDRNPNVFYELGVRHALADRTILVAQDRLFIPSDLESYANHVYDWKTPEGKLDFKAKIKKLLEDVDRAPDWKDNPVSDFLVGTKKADQQSPSELRWDETEQRIDRLELLIEGTDAGRRTSSINAVKDTPILGDEAASGPWFMIGVELADSKGERDLLRIVRRARNEIRLTIPNLITRLTVADPPRERIQNSEILGIAEQYEMAFGSPVSNLEQLALGLATVDWKPGGRAILQLAGSLIEAGNNRTGVKFSVGLPAFIGWRMLLNCGATAWADGASGVSEVLLAEPLPVTLPGGRKAIRALWQQHSLFFPTFVLGYADLGMKQLLLQFEQSSRLEAAFHAQEEYNFALAQFLILVAMCDAREGDPTIYPGYRLVPEFRDACAGIVTAARTNRRRLIADLFGVAPENLEEEWQRRAMIANTSKLGAGYLFDEARIPDDLTVQEL